MKKKPRKRTKKLSVELKIVSVSLVLGILSLLLAARSFIIVTEEKIFISGLETFLQTKEYSFDRVQGVKIRGKQGKGGASIKFYLLIEHREFDIWPGGWYDRSNISENVRSVYQKLKQRKVPVDSDLSHLNKKQQDLITGILE